MKKPIFKSLFQGFDFTLSTIIFLCSMFGITAIMSAVHSYDNSLKYIIIQSAATLIGITGMIVISSIDYNFLGNLSKYIYACCIALLVLVLLIGTGEDINSKSWIQIGGFNFQPSELVKIGFVITFSSHLSKIEDVNKPKNLLMLFLHAVPILALILLQPDAGTAMVFVIIIIGMLFVAGISFKYIFGAIAGIGVLLPAIWPFLQTYQKKRILVFLNPESDPLGAGYHVIQSKIAIGSGKIFGKGLFNGTQTQLGFLPAKHTDFIFAVIGEELGLVGAALVFLLLMALVIRCIYVSNLSKNSLGTYICVGIAFMFAAHIFENIGMCIGLMPVTGIPLPFFSYGGSSVISNYIAAGIVINVYKQRRRILY